MAGITIAISLSFAEAVDGNHAIARGLQPTDEKAFEPGSLAVVGDEKPAEQQLTEGLAHGQLDEIVRGQPVMLIEAAI
jgi:hypothetical protein